MIKMSYSTKDIEGYEIYGSHHKIDMEWDGCDEDNIEEITEKFKEFLRALGYGESSIGLIEVAER